MILASDGEWLKNEELFYMLVWWYLKYNPSMHHILPVSHISLPCLVSYRASCIAVYMVCVNAEWTTALKANICLISGLFHFHTCTHWCSIFESNRWIQTKLYSLPYIFITFTSIFWILIVFPVIFNISRLIQIISFVVYWSSSF